MLISYAWMKAKQVPECDLAYQKARIELSRSFCMSAFSSFSPVYSRISLGCIVVGSVRLKRGSLLTVVMRSIGAGSRLLELEDRNEDGPKSHGLSVRDLFL